MRRVRTGTGTSFDATDDVAESLLDYCWALADLGRTDVVLVPVRRSDGSVERLPLLLGPVSDLSVEAVPGAEDDLDPALSADLRTRTTLLGGRSRAHVDEAPRRRRPD